MMGEETFETTTQPNKERKEHIRNGRAQQRKKPTTYKTTSPTKETINTYKTTTKHNKEREHKITKRQQHTTTKERHAYKTAKRNKESKEHIKNGRAHQIKK